MRVQCKLPDAYSGMNFFLINKVISPSLTKPIYKSEIQPGTGGVFTWNQVSVLSADLAGDDVDREIKFDFYQSSKTGKHTFLGKVSLTIAQLKEG